MDDVIPEYSVYGPLTEYVIEQGKQEPVTLRDHLDALRTYADKLYEHNAQSALESLDPEELDMVPEEVVEEESPYCVVYYLPNGQLLRILPVIFRSIWRLFFSAR